MLKKKKTDELLTHRSKPDHKTWDSIFRRWWLWKVFPRMWSRVIWWVLINVLEETASSILRVEEITVILRWLRQTVSKWYYLCTNPHVATPRKTTVTPVHTNRRVEQKFQMWWWKETSSRNKNRCVNIIYNSTLVFTRRNSCYTIRKISFAKYEQV